MRYLQVLGGLMLVPDLPAVRCRARLWEMFGIPAAHMLAENGRECKPHILSTHVHQAGMRARGEMATLSVPSLTSDIVADRAAGIGDSCGPTPALPLCGDMHR